MRFSSLAILAAIAAPFLPTFTQNVAADEPTRLSGPIAHENLAVYFIHGTSTPGPVPLTLKEAMEAGRIVVHETGSVNSLSIENAGSEEVFVQAGDIVKGGQQDRVLTVSFLVPARSGRLSIGAYCVEQGRWAARGGEDVKKFASSDKSLPSREAKLAMLAPAKARPSEMTTGPQGPSPAIATEPAQRRIPNQTASREYSDTGSRQTEMWRSVAQAQTRLSANLGANVAEAKSASSLQLSLENAKLAEAHKAYVAALRPGGDVAEDIIGYIVAVGGKLTGGDVYSSNALFRKMWSKQLEAAATEAIAEKDLPAASLPDIANVRAFLTAADAGTAVKTDIAGTAQVKETRDADKVLLAETRRTAGGLVHRAYLAR